MMLDAGLDMILSDGESERLGSEWEEGIGTVGFREPGALVRNPPLVRGIVKVKQQDWRTLESVLPG